MISHDPSQPPRSGANTVRWVGLGVFGFCDVGGILVFAAALFPVFKTARGAAQKTATLSNSKQSALAALMYSADWNDRLPLDNVWMDALSPYIKNDMVFHSLAFEKPGPNVYGFAFRRDLVEKKLTKIPDPERWAMIFESVNVARNATSNLETLPVPGRWPSSTGRQNVVAFADGHAKAMQDNPTAISQMTGKPVPK
jgi:prepilin-type processing-associated H-X9-DG protein